MWIPTFIVVAELVVLVGRVSTSCFTRFNRSTWCRLWKGRQGLPSSVSGHHSLSISSRQGQRMRQGKWGSVRRVGSSKVRGGQGNLIGWWRDSLYSGQLETDPNRGVATFQGYSILQPLPPSVHNTGVATLRGVLIRESSMS